MDRGEWPSTKYSGNSLCTVLPPRAGVLCCNCVALVTGLQPVLVAPSPLNGSLIFIASSPVEM